MKFRCHLTLIKNIMILFNLTWVVIGIAFMTTGTAMLIEDGGYKFSFDVFSELYSMNFVFILGCLIFMISWIGCFSALRESQFLLNIYAGIVMLQLFVQISLLLSTLVYRTEICEQIAEEYERIFINRDKGLNGQFVTLIQRHFHCCGSVGPESYLPQLPPPSCGAAQNGCVETISNYIIENYSFIEYFAAIIIGFEVAGLIMAIILVNRMNEINGMFLV